MAPVTRKNISQLPARDAPWSTSQLRGSCGQDDIDQDWAPLNSVIIILKEAPAGVGFIRRVPVLPLAVKAVNFGQYLPGGLRRSLR